MDSQRKHRSDVFWGLAPLNFTKLSEHQRQDFTDLIKMWHVEAQPAHEAITRGLILRVGLNSRRK